MAVWLVPVVSAAAPALGSAASASAVVTPWRKRSAEGVSAPATAVGMTCAALWLTYWAMCGAPAQVLPNLVGVVVRMLLLALLVVYGDASRRRIVAAVGIGVAVGPLVALVGGVPAVAVIAVAGTLVAGLPQLAMTVRHGPGAGVSAVGLRLGVAASAAWLAYGLAECRLPVVVASLWGLAVTAVTLGCVRSPQGRFHRGVHRGAVRVRNADVLLCAALVQVAPRTERLAGRLPTDVVDALVERHHRVRANLTRLAG